MTLPEELQSLASKFGAELLTINTKVHQFKEKTAIDVFGSSTRSYADKLLLTCAIGILLGTVGKVDKTLPLGPITINVESVYVIPIAVVFIIIYYGIALAILARSDFVRWTALLGQSNESIKEFAAMVVEASGYAVELLQRTANPKDQEKLRKIVQNYAEVCSQLADLSVQSRKRVKQAIVVFIVLPLFFGVITVCLLIYSLFIVRGAS
jgi:hypothetical protein